MPKQFEQEYDQIVQDDIAYFEARIADLQEGRLTDDEFRAHRLRRGIYRQRQPGVQMVRTKIPGGIATAEQIEVLADIAEQFAESKAHLTTRQNFQFHFVPLSTVPNLLRQLAKVRLTTREACYNTVRNITACPHTGLSANELFPISPYVRRVAFALLHKDVTDNLPRKFKIAFSACGQDCMIGAIHDVGLTPVLRGIDGEQQRGFRMVVAGGLGPMPREAELLEEFVPAERLVNKIEAIVRVFAKYGNRKNKHKARLKFVMAERGFAWFSEAVQKEYDDILTNGGILVPAEVPENFGGFQSDPQPIGNGTQLPIWDGATAAPGYDQWLEANVGEQKQPGLSTVMIRVDQGNLSASQLRGLAQISRQAGDGLVRITIDQNLMLGNIPLAHLKRVYRALQDAGLSTGAAAKIDDITSCPGAYSCNLGITKSMNLADALSQVVAKNADSQVRSLSIKISGCPNSCGQHWIADLGFFGNVRKFNGKEVPYYQMLLGGGFDEAGVWRFGLGIQSIPAKLAPEAVSRILSHFVANRIEGESFRQYVLRNKVDVFRQMTMDLAKPVELFPEIYQDWGDDAPFSLQLGRAECAA